MTSRGMEHARLRTVSWHSFGSMSSQPCLHYLYQVASNICTVDHLSIRIVFHYQLYDLHTLFSWQIGSVVCSIFNPLKSIVFSLEISQTSHHLSSSSNLSLCSCLLPLYHNHHPLLQFSASSINGLDPTLHFSSNCFFSAFCSFCFCTVMWLLSLLPCFSGSSTSEFFWVYSSGSWDTSVPNSIPIGNRSDIATSSSIDFSRLPCAPLPQGTTLCLHVHNTL